MNQDFNLTRLGLFVKRQLLLNINSLWIGIVAVTGLLLAASVILPYFRGVGSVAALVNLYGFAFFICGFVLTSKVYAEMQSPQQSYMFLTLPVSTTEKLVGAWLITSPIFILVASFCFSVLMIISALIVGESAFAFFKSKYLFLNMRDVGAYMVFQTLFLLGACAFRGNNFMKTLLAVFIFFTLLALYTGGVGYLLFGNRGNIGPHSFPATFKDTVEFVSRQIVPFLFWFILPLFLLVVSYFKLKERQV